MFPIQCNLVCMFQCGMSTGGNAEGYSAPTPQGSFIGKDHSRQNRKLLGGSEMRSIVQLLTTPDSGPPYFANPTFLLCSFFRTAFKALFWSVFVLYGSGSRLKSEYESGSFLYFAYCRISIFSAEKVNGKHQYVDAKR